MQITKPKLLSLFALMMLIVSVFFCAGTTTAFAAETPPVITATTETLSVDEVWLTGDTLHIAVMDKTSSKKQTLELKLSDYAKSGDEYVSVQATDTSGRTSNVIQFKNPYYVPIEGHPSEITESPAPSGAETESAIPNGEKDGGDGRPFTPDGAGSVVDNATDKDGKEFFTVKTADGNEFYLIVDRQRNAENVYFLNAVTEGDLKSLAKADDGKTPESAIPTPTAPVVTPNTEQPTTPTPTPTPDLPAGQAGKSDGNNSTMILIVIAVLAVGGAGYYFKIVRPKKEAADDFGDSWNEPDDDEEMPLGGDESEVGKE